MFWHDQGSSMAPPANLAEVTPNDTTDLPNKARAIWVDVEGVVRVDGDESGANIPFTIPAGQWVPMRIKRVRATGTAATGIKVGY